jgi:hypothetical protein
MTHMVVSYVNLFRASEESKGQNALNLAPSERGAGRDQSLEILQISQPWPFSALCHTFQRSQITNVNAVVIEPSQPTSQIDGFVTLD